MTQHLGKYSVLTHGATPVAAPRPATAPVAARRKFNDIAAAKLVPTVTVDAAVDDDYSGHKLKRKHFSEPAITADYARVKAWLDSEQEKLAARKREDAERRRQREIELEHQIAATLAQELGLEPLQTPSARLIGDIERLARADALAQTDREQAERQVAAYNGQVRLEGVQQMIALGTDRENNPDPHAISRLMTPPLHAIASAGLTLAVPGLRVTSSPAARFYAPADAAKAIERVNDSRRADTERQAQKRVDISSLPATQHNNSSEKVTGLLEWVYRSRAEKEAAGLDRQNRQDRASRAVTEQEIFDRLVSKRNEPNLSSDHSRGRSRGMSYEP